MKRTKQGKLPLRLRYSLSSLTILPIILFIALFPFSCRVLVYNIPDITDHKHFPYTTIENSKDSVFYFFKSEDSKDLGKEIFVSNDFLSPNVVNLDTYIEDSKSAAFLIIRNDSILYENYDDSYGEKTLFNIFSVTKVFVSTLIGIAIDEGAIKSVDQPITDFLPQFSENEGFEKITIRHLLLHTSGIKSSERKYNPISENARFYYHRNLRKLVMESELSEPPGSSMHYASINTQILGMILEKATKTAGSEYLEEKIWKTIGMEYPARWNTDLSNADPIEKYFSSLNCTVIDLAKLGRLYSNNGLWDGQQILSKRFIDEATRRDSTGGSNLSFQYNFKPGPMQDNSYHAIGLYGQLLVVYPVENMVIIRIGEPDLKYNPPFLSQTMVQIIEQLRY